MSRRDVAAVPAGAVQARGVGRRFVLRSARTDRSLVDVILRREGPASRELWALRDVSLEIEPGQAYGIVGRNGSGKSTLLKLLAGIFNPSEGTIAVGGRVGSLLEVGAGFHPEFTGTENVYLSAAVHGIPRTAIADAVPEIMAFAELEGFADSPVKTYSSGMYTRLGFSVAMYMDPDVLLLDEVLAVGDEAFQQKCFARIWEYRRHGGTLVFVSHDASSVERLCDRAILLEHGRAVAEGTPEEVLSDYHRRLAHRATPAPAAAAAAAAALAAEEGAPLVRIAAVRARGADGAWRERFIEGEPVVIEAVLVAAEDVTTGIGIRVRMPDGREVGGQVLERIDLVAGEPTPVRLHWHPFPVRSGGCRIDVGVGEYGSLPIEELTGALELTMIGDEAGEVGPVRLGGHWEWPPVTPIADAASFAPRLGA